MSNIKITIDKNIYQYIDLEIQRFIKRTWEGNDVDFNDVIYSFLYSTKDTFCVLNDWDEGKDNDPYWDEEKNMHSVESFLVYIVDELRMKTGLEPINLKLKT